MSDINLYSELLSEKQKDSSEYLQRMADHICNILVYDKDHIRKAYNYYNGIMDKDQYRNLEENYGIGSPTSVEFVPLIRKHVDALMGRYLQNKIKPRVTCKDKNTLTSIFRQKQLQVETETFNRIQEQLNNNLLYAMMSQEEKQQKQPPVDNATQKELEKLKEDIDRNFISEYERSAQYMLKFISQNKDIDLNNKKKILFLDLLAAGQCYYETSCYSKGETPDLEVLNPMDVFYWKNNNSPYVKDSTYAVVRRYMNKQQIISKYGSLMDRDDIKKLDGELGSMDNFKNNVIYVRTNEGSLVSNIGVATVDPIYDQDNTIPYNNYYTVYECQWLSNNKIVGEDGKTTYRTDRYRCIKIGNGIYIELGKDEEVVRSIEHPNRCSLSINGVAYSDRNGKPYSLVIALMPIQDKYNILCYFRDSLIASSGIRGDFVDVSQLPDFLGKTPQERLLKYIGYKKKMGVALINTAQEGNGNNLNTIYKGYDDTVSMQSLQGIQAAMDQTEAICSSITGVYREQLGGIEQRDAVTNVQVSANTSTVVTKQYYQTMDSITDALLIDMLNLCKISYKEGMIGQIVLGDKLQKIFTIDPQYFSFTDYDVHIADSSDILLEMQKIEQITYKLIETGQVDLDVVFEGLTSESLSEMKEDILKSYRKKKDENDQLSQASQQIQQYQQQLQELQKQLQQAQGKLEQINQDEIEIKKQKVQNDYEIAKESNEITKDLGIKKVNIDDKKIDIEVGQLYDGNPYNNKIKMS